jgi:hypothetical protein
MARTSTSRKSPRKSPAKAVRKTTRRGLNPAKLPYAAEADAANDVIDFLFTRLPNFIARELRDLDIAIDRANLYRELSGLSDAALKKCGLKRSDLPVLVANTFRLMDLSKGRKAGRGRRPTAKRRTQGAKRKAAKRTAAKRKTARR